MKLHRVLSQGIAVAMLSLPLTKLAHSEPITINDTFHFLENRSANSVGINAGVRQQFGAVTVTPSAGTTGTASQAGVVVPLIFQPQTVAPNFFSTSLGANFAPDGQWSLTFNNGADTASAMTPGIAGATLLSHPTSVAISGSGNAPTFSWTNPTGSPIDAVRLQIWDRDSIINPQGQSDIIFSKTFGGLTNTFTVDPFALSLVNGRNYSFEISLLDLRDPLAGGGNPNILSRSRSFFDFTLLDPSITAQVYLPTVSSDGTQPIFQFSVDVAAGQQIFIDPLIAVGYDYQIGAGDPLIQNILLPSNIGDGRYDISLWNGSEWVIFMTDVEGGTDIELDPLGVDRFRVSGIEADASLNPEDPTAFVTGLTFASDGRFTGTMTPITVNVPEPGTLALMAAALLAGAIRPRARGTNEAVT